MQNTFRRLEKAEIWSSCRISWEGTKKYLLHFLVVLRLSALIKEHQKIQATVRKFPKFLKTYCRLFPLCFLFTLLRKWYADFFWHFIRMSGMIFSPSVGERRFRKCGGVDPRQFLIPSPRPLPHRVLIWLRQRFSHGHILKYLSSLQND